MTECKVALGGTFSVLHRGHKSLIDKACSIGDSLVIGLTTDRFVKSRKTYGVPDYDTRKRNLENYLKELNCSYEISPLDSSLGSSVSREDICAIVVSQETLSNARLINDQRIRNGLKELSVIAVPTVLSDDLFPLSSFRTINGYIDANGKSISPVGIVISTRNKLKVKAAERALREIFPKFTVRMNTSYETADQPFGDDTAGMAIIRAKSAKEFQYSIAVESGIFHDRNTLTYYDVHVCAVLDCYGNITLGYSSGFQIPPDLVDKVKTGMDESNAFFNLYGKKDIGSAGGVVHHFSNGRVDRESLIMECIRNAFIPRYRPYEYGLHFNELMQE